MWITNLSKHIIAGTNSEERFGNPDKCKREHGAVIPNNDDIEYVKLILGFKTDRYEMGSDCELF